jgi:hypothetical protein
MVGVTDGTILGRGVGGSAVFVGTIAAVTTTAGVSVAWVLVQDKRMKNRKKPSLGLIGCLVITT